MRAVVGEIELEYEFLGDAGARPLLLIMGLGSQLVTWPDGFCQALVDRGFHVLRFDNRDAGLSTHLDHLPLSPPPYTLDDMADDAVALLDHVGIARAHVMGASMGGMIAQVMAINHPERVLSLTSVMSHLGGEDAVQASSEVIASIFTPPEPDREAPIERALNTRRILAGGNSIDEARARAHTTREVDRAHDPAGVARQGVALKAAPSRRQALGGLTIPVLVVHGVDDPLVPPENGRRTAAAIPGAGLMEVPAMGHNLPESAWAPIADAVSALAEAALPVS